MERKSRTTSKPSAAELPKDPRERATSVDSNQDPRYGATGAPDWLITFLSKQEEREYKREQLEEERERARDEKHDLSMRLLCEAIDRRISTIHQRANATTAPVTSLMIHKLNALRPTSSALLPAHTLKLDHLSQ